MIVLDLAPPLLTLSVLLRIKPEIANKELEKMREALADKVEQTEYIVEIEAYVGSPKQFIGKRKMTLAEARKQLPDLVEHFGNRKMR